MPAYNKPYLDIDQQIERLKCRGMEIVDEEQARICLSRIGYYRLSAFWHPYLKSTVSVEPTTKRGTTTVHDEFRPGARFSDAYEFYAFDKRLRLIVLDALEVVEIGVRSEICDFLGKRDPWAHRNPDQLDGRFAPDTQSANGDESKHEEWLSRLDSRFEGSTEEFASHFRQRYAGDNPPIWIAAEVWDFGMLSYFYAGMKGGDRNSIANKFGVYSGQVLKSWLRNLNGLRNVCAHHQRLWNRSSVFQPKWPPKGYSASLDHLAGNTHGQTRFYASAVMLCHFLRTIDPVSCWPERLKAHVRSLPASPHLTIGGAGFPEGWESEQIWA